MSHISELALFDHVSKEAELTTQELDHLKECGDCQNEVIRVERVVQDSTDIEKSRRFLAEEGALPSPEEPPREVLEERRELDDAPEIRAERSGGSSKPGHQ